MIPCETHVVQILTRNSSKFDPATTNFQNSSDLNAQSDDTDQHDYLLNFDAHPKASLAMHLMYTLDASGNR